MILAGANLRVECVDPAVLAPAHCAGGDRPQACVTR